MDPPPGSTFGSSRVKRESYLSREESLDTSEHSYVSCPFIRWKGECGGLCLVSKPGLPFALRVEPMF